MGEACCLRIDININEALVYLCVCRPGNAVANLFLQHRVNQTWKDKYIKALVSMSGIYAGAGLPLYSMV